MFDGDFQLPAGLEVEEELRDGGATQLTFRNRNGLVAAFVQTASSELESVSLNPAFCGYERLLARLWAQKDAAQLAELLAALQPCARPCCLCGSLFPQGCVQFEPEVVIQQGAAAAAFGRDKKEIQAQFPMENAFIFEIKDEWIPYKQGQKESKFLAQLLQPSGDLKQADVFEFCDEAKVLGGGAVQWHSSCAAWLDL